MKKRVYQILNVSQRRGDLSWWVDVFLITLISLNVLAIILESVASLWAEYEACFLAFEAFSVAVFSLEYLLRVWSANEDPAFEKPIGGNLRYMLTPLAIIDLLAVLPFYLPLLGVDLRIVRMMRIFRLLRLFKINRYTRALTAINKVLKDKREELFISMTFTFFLLLLASTLMYYAEHEAQPEAFSSIPHTMWWGIATLTTVGYGDVYPITNAGRVLGGIIAVIGIGLFALPTGILASGFSEEIGKKEEAAPRHTCPHCNKELP